MTERNARNTTRSRRGSVGTAARSLRRGATRVAAQRPPGDSATVRAAPLGGSGCFKVSLLLALPGARRAEFRTDYAAIRSTFSLRRRVLRRAAQRRLQLPFWAYIAKTSLGGPKVARSYRKSLFWLLASRLRHLRRELGFSFLSLVSYAASWRAQAQSTKHAYKQPRNRKERVVFSLRPRLQRFASIRNKTP